MIRIQHKPGGSKNLYMAQNLALGDRVTGKATVQLVRMGRLLKVYLHQLSQQNAELLPLTPGTVHLKTLKNSELIQLLIPTQSTAHFFLALNQKVNSTGD